MPHPKLLSTSNAWASWLAVILVVTVIWAAKAVLMPLALGVILAFMLTPLVRLFDHWRLPRFIGVALTMLLALSAVGAVGYVAFDQFTDLSTQVTRYTSSMRNKVAELRMGNDAAIKKFTRTVERVTEQLDDNVADLRRAQPVRVVPPRMTPAERLQEAANSVFEPLVSAFIVIVLVAFMLGQREDLRDRFIRLIGPESVTLTTRVLDETAQRVGRFIVTQTLLNMAFGVLVSAGLYWIGVPYAALWGGLTALLRFVPYVGTLLSTLAPALLAFATFPGWTQTLQTLGLFVSLDLLAAYFVEPFVLGRRTGVSSFALLVSALFWIWVWGPIGLLLATPLTVCFAVLGRHVRSLRFLAVLFAGEPALTPHVRFYQRLLARDEEEAGAIIDQKREELGPAGLIDYVLAPALSLVIQHRSEEEITTEDAHFMLEVIEEVVQEMSSAPTAESPRIIGVATRTPADQLVIEMLGAAMGGRQIEVLAAELSTEQALGRIIERRPALVCVGVISPTRSAEVRMYCRRLRTALPATKIMVLRPTLVEADASKPMARLKDAGADYVANGAQDALEAIGRLLGEQDVPALTEAHVGVA